MHSNLGEDLRKKRKQFGITQAMLADEVGVSRKYICDFENGKVSDNPQMVKAIFDTLKRFNPDTPLELLIDYCRIRFPTKDVKYVIEHLLQLKIKYFGVEDYSFYAYKQQYYIGDVVVMASDKDDLGVMLELKGKGCRQFECYLKAQKTNDGQTRGWIGFLRDCLKADAVMKRLDIAINDLTGVLNVNMLAEKCKRGEYQSVFRSFKEYLSGEYIQMHEDEDKKLLMGKTLYIGSLKSDIYFCIYEKDYEQFLKNYAQNRLDGFGIEDMEVKNRFEIRLKNDRAYHAACDLVSNEEPEETTFGIINRYLCFLDRDETKRREDWRINRCWVYFIGEHRGKLKLTTKPEPFSFSRTMGWMKKQVAPSLRTILELDKIKGTNNLGSIIDDAKLQDKHHKLIMQQSVPIEELIVSQSFDKEENTL